MSSNDLREQSGSVTITDVVWIISQNYIEIKTLLNIHLKLLGGLKMEKCTINRFNCIAFRRYGYSSCTFFDIEIINCKIYF